MRIVEPRADVERRVVVGDVDDRAFTRHGSLNGIALGEAGDAFRSSPQRFIEAAIDIDRLAAAEPYGTQLLGRGK